MCIITYFGMALNIVRRAPQRLSVRPPRSAAAGLLRAMKSGCTDGDAGLVASPAVFICASRIRELHATVRGHRKTLSGFTSRWKLPFLGAAASSRAIDPLPEHHFERVNTPPHFVRRASIGSPSSGEHEERASASVTRPRGRVRRRVSEDLPTSLRGGSRPRGLVARELACAAS